MTDINIVEVNNAFLKDFENRFLIKPIVLKDIYKNNLHYFAGFQDKKVIFILQLYIENIFIIKRIIPPPFLPYNDLLINLDKNISTAKQHDYNKLIINSLSHFLLSNYRYSLINLSLSNQIYDTQAFFWNKFKVIPNYTYQIDLNKTENDILTNFSSVKKSLIKKAFNDNFEFKEDELENLNKMIYLTFLRKKMLKKWNLYYKFVNILNNNNIMRIFSAYKDNCLLGSCAFLEKNKKVYFLFSGHNTEIKHPSSISFILYKAIFYYKEKGFEIFDFEGSMIKEVEKGFRQFGGELIQYHTINNAPFPIEMILKLKYKNRF